MRFDRAVVLGLAALLGACASRVAQKEDLLAAAGFQFRPADTPERAAALQRLPAHHFVHQTRNGRPVWIYADPTVCGCLYVGGDAAYSAYKREVFQKRLADERQLAAQMNDDAAMQQMQWGMWGPWAPYDY